MREKMLEVYEMVKKVDLEECRKYAEELKSNADEVTLRLAIHAAESSRSKLRGMLLLMDVAGVISINEHEERKKELEELFSTRRLYDAFVLICNGDLVKNISEAKKRTKKSDTFLSPVILANLLC